MENVPVYISLFFVLTTIFAADMLFKAANYNRLLIIITLIWLILQAFISISGFYTVTSGTPPRFALLLMPPVIFVVILFFSNTGRQTIDIFNLKTLTLLQTVRIPVELTLYWLYLHKAVPQVMTFEGRNFDILCGLTVPLIYYFGYINNRLGKRIILAWNIVCLLLLANIIVLALLSGPFVFQMFGFGQPNIALFYFPFIWLPCFIVPAVLFAHLAAIRKILIS